MYALNPDLVTAANVDDVLRRVRLVAPNIAEHFTTNVKPRGFKAFLVAVDREACALYKQSFDPFSRQITAESSIWLTPKSHRLVDPILLTLADDLLKLLPHLVEYVICHELLHLKVPHHNKFYYLLLGQHIPDWRHREQALSQWVLQFKT